jgi:hypothetical protein
MVNTKFHILCGLCVLILTGLSASSALSDLASTMSAGEWAELSTNNIVPTLTANGASGIVFGYTEDIKWDPVSQQLFFSGGDHADASHFISYTESNNTWQRLDNAPYLYGGGGSAQHGYDHSAIVPDSGWFFHRPFGSRNWYRYHIPSETWKQMPPTTSSVMEYNCCCVGIEYFPELNSIIYASLESGTMGSLIRFSFDTNQWMRVGPGKNLAMGGLHHFAEYNPKHKLAIFGGGNGSSDIYKVESNGQITKMGNAPVTIGVQSSIQTVDPVSGDYLVFTRNNQFYVYDVINDTWTQQSGSVPIWTTSYSNAIHGVVATPVSTYGIVLFVTCNHSSCKVSLYKHSAGNSTAVLPVSSALPEIRVAPNPFKPVTKIFIILPLRNAGASERSAPAFLSEKIDLRIYDIRGNLVKKWMAPANGKGTQWHAGHLPGGAYLLKAVWGGRTYKKKLMLLK